jgi:hypothetical protein
MAQQLDEVQFIVHDQKLYFHVRFSGDSPNTTTTAGLRFGDDLVTTGPVVNGMTGYPPKRNPIVIQLSRFRHSIRLRWRT